MKFIPMAIPSLGRLEEKLVQQCVKSSWISSSGEFIEKFENSFAEYFKVKHAISCANGTVALHLALLVLGIGPKDEVILPTLSFVATANAIKYVGAVPIFVDSDINSWNINTSLIEEKITKRTRAILPVHLYGYPADMKTITSLAKKYRLAVVEDAAEAHGARIGTKFVGSIGDLGCFSFYGNKIITTGEGGMVITNSTRLAQKIRLLKNHGMSPTRRYWHPVIGYNYRMTNMQAALGYAQLKQFPKFVKKRNQIKSWYRQRLSQIDSIQLFAPDTKGISSVNWLFTIRVIAKGKKSRDNLMKYLKKYGVDSRPAFFPITDFPSYKNTERFPIAATIANQGINLPTYVNLTRQQVTYITSTIERFFLS